jgi:hypothetical protein
VICSSVEELQTFLYLCFARQRKHGGADGRHHSVQPAGQDP